MENKMEVYMQILQSYCNDEKAVKCREDEYLAIRTAIQKVSSTLNSDEKKSALVHNELYAQAIVYALQVFQDRIVRILIFRLLLRLFRKSGFKTYAPILVHKGLTRALFQALYSESCEPNPNEELMVRLHQLLCRLGRLDKRFAIRARISQCLPITLGLLRSQVALLCTYGPVTSSAASSSCPSGSAGVFVGTSSSSLPTTSVSSTHSTSGLPLIVPDSTCPSRSTGSNSQSAHTSMTGTIPFIPNSVNHNLVIILHALRLYVLNVSGKTNSSVLGRMGAIPLLIRLLSIIAGLPPPRTYPEHLSSNTNSNKSTTMGPANGIQTNSTDCVLTNSHTTVSVSSSTCANNTPTTASNVIGVGGPSTSTTPLSRCGTETGLVIGSPIVTAITAIASAAATIQRYQLRTAPHRSNNTSTGNQSTSVNYLASSAFSLLSAPPHPIACGVQNYPRLLRLVLHTLNCLTKCRRNAGIAINSGGISLLVDLFLDIHRCDLLGKKLSLQRCSLACLRNLTTTRIGRKVFITCGGLHAFFALCSGYVGPHPLSHMTQYASPSKPKLCGDANLDSKNRKNQQKFTELHTPSFSNIHETTTTSTSVSAQSVNLNVDSSKTNLPTKLDIDSINSFPPNFLNSAGSSTSASVAITLPPTPSAASTFRALSNGPVNTLDSNNTTDIASKRKLHSCEMMTILDDACMLLRKCCPRIRLPVANAEGIFRCPLPRTRRTLQSDPQCPKAPAAMDSIQKSETTLPEADITGSSPHGSPSFGDPDSTAKVLPSTESFPDVCLSEGAACTEPISHVRNLVGPECDHERDSMGLIINKKHASLNTNRVKKPTNRISKVGSNKKAVHSHQLRLPRVGIPRLTNKTVETVPFGVIPFTHDETADLLPRPKNSPNLITSEGTPRRLRHSLTKPKATKRLTGHRSQRNSSFGSGGPEHYTVASTNSKIPSPSAALRVISLSSKSPSDTCTSHFPVESVQLTSGLIASEEGLSCCDLSTPPDKIDVSSSNRHNLSPNLPGIDDDDDDDDDDTNDDDDDDEDLNEAEAAAARTDDETSSKDPRTVIANLLESHGCFFPEWIDIPCEYPSCLTQDDATTIRDSHSVSWPIADDPFCQPLVDSNATDNSHKSANIGKLQDESDSTFPVRYLNHTRHTHGLIPFRTIAYPDLIGAPAAPFVEPFYNPNDFFSHPYLHEDSLDTSTECPSIQHGHPDTSDCQPVMQETPVSEKDTNCRQVCKPRSARSLARSRESNSTGQSIASSSTRRLSKSTGTLPKSHTNPRLPYSLDGLTHTLLLDDVRRLVFPEDVLNRVVFDLDELVLTTLRNSQQPQRIPSPSNSPRPVHLSLKSTPLPAGESSSFVEAESMSACSQPTNTVFHASNRSYSGSSLLSNPSAPDVVDIRFPNSTYPEGSHLCDPDVECSPSGDCLLTNVDEVEVNHFDLDKGHLMFESRFESGNLRKAIQVRQYEYDLILNPDVNTTSNLQWFYFRVSNVESGVDYRFNLINCEKPGSQFTSGMQPLLFSVRDALEGRAYWKRVGKRINYYRNHFMRASDVKRVNESNTYFTATFTLQFPYTGDVCYLAYHYPYTYTRLLTDIVHWKATSDWTSASSKSKIYLRVQTLTHTILGNAVPVVTITENFGARPDHLQPSGPSIHKDAACADQTDTVNRTFNSSDHTRPYIFLTARVHSGEANSSWVIRGLLDRLTSGDPTATTLRQAFVFKIIPMLNPDGVICGNHRCSMAGKDLNRRWLNPSVDIHPTIYHTKKLLQLLHACGRQPYIFIDFHGHSRMKNIFLYGCSPLESWRNPDTHNPTSVVGSPLQEDRSYRHLAELLDTFAPAFAKQSCMYVVNKSKESTARIAVWREFNVLRSYTIEASYCGLSRYLGSAASGTESRHAHNGHQLNPVHLSTFGAHLLDALAKLPSYDEQHPSFPTHQTKEAPTTLLHPSISSCIPTVSQDPVTTTDASDHTDSLSKSVSTISSVSSDVSLSSSNASLNSLHHSVTD